MIESRPPTVKDLREFLEQYSDDMVVVTDGQKRDLSPEF